MNSSTTKMKELIGDLLTEVCKIEKPEKEIEDLKKNNEILKRDLRAALETIRKLETKQNELEQENAHLKSQKQKLKLVVVKLKRKRESEKTKMQSTKRPKTTNQTSSMKFIDLSSDMSNETIFTKEFQESTRIDFSNSNLPVPTIDSTKDLPSNSTKKSPTIPDASDRIRNIFEPQTQLNPRKKADRLKMESKPCEQCKQWYGESWEHMKDTCKHRYQTVPPSTPENFWNVNYPQTQDD